MLASDPTAAKRKAIKERYKRQAAEASGYPVAHRGAPLAVRVAQLNRLFARRYGDELPDDDDGRVAAWVMACHMAYRTNGSSYYIAKWVHQWASWMDSDELDALITRAIDKPHRFGADKIAEILSVTEAERTELRLTTIGSIDKTSAERKAERKERDRLTKEAGRRAAGKPTRAEWEAKARRNTRPWEALNPPISERTWYRQQKRAALIVDCQPQSRTRAPSRKRIA